jgi:hypothetical protein
MSGVAVLYADPKGPYPRLPVDVWDVSRDARTYAGPFPVVAHPPCGPWGQLRRLYKGGEGGADCGPLAVDCVRRWGGVLEHPRGSLLFTHCGMPRPGDPPDEWGGRTYALEQVSWGHACRKPTWIYVVGVSPETVLAGIRTGGEPTHQIWGQRGSTRHRADLLGANAGMRRRTPPAFADWLVSLAAQAVVP